MQKRSLRDIKTFANLTDGRRARTPHGAYLELASLALHKHRLLKERHFAESRNAAIEAQIREMDRKTGVLRSFVEDPRSFTVRPPERPMAGEPNGGPSTDPASPAIREQELRY